MVVLAHSVGFRVGTVQSGNAGAGETDSNKDIGTHDKIAGGCPTGGTRYRGTKSAFG